MAELSVTRKEKKEFSRHPDLVVFFYRFFAIPHYFVEEPLNSLEKLILIHILKLTEMTFLCMS